MSSTAAKTRWFTELLDSASMSSDTVASRASELKTLDQWFVETLESLNAAELDFAPYVLEEDAPVVQRIRALGEFCGGFTYGVGIALSQRGEKPLPEDTREIIDDFQAIEASDPEDTSGLQTPEQTDGGANAGSSIAEQQEAMFVELLEFVRVGVLIVLEELRPVSVMTQEKVS